MKKIFIFLILILFCSPVLHAKSPKGFKVIYKSSAGQLEKGTKEQIEVSSGKIVVNKNAVQVGNSEVSHRTKEYKINDEQFELLYKIVMESGFMSWPATSEGEHQSQVEESFQITADGKTVTHQRWEQGNEEKFRILFKKFNDWFNSVRTAWF